MSGELIFTERRIENPVLSPAGLQQLYYRDAKTRGSAVAVNPTGAKTFIRYRKIQGRAALPRVYPGRRISPGRRIELACKVPPRLRFCHSGPVRVTPRIKSCFAPAG